MPLDHGADGGIVLMSGKGPDRKGRTMESTAKNSKINAIEIHREGNTYYAFADSGEMIASAPGRISCLQAIGWEMERRGVVEALVCGRLWNAAGLKAAHQ
jgi:hypothetical protein